MSLAICIKCGARKTSAGALCDVCGFRGVDIEDLARSMFLTDHYQQPRELKAASRQIQAGKFTFDDQKIAPIVKELQQEPALVERLRRSRPFTLPLLIRVLLIALLITWLILKLWRALSER